MLVTFLLTPLEHKLVDNLLNKTLNIVKKIEKSTLYENNFENNVKPQHQKIKINFGNQKIA